MLSQVAEPPQPARVWTVFCAECTNNFDYKSIGVFWSHKLSKMPGGLTRLLACDSHQLANYKGLNIGNTFVHQNYGKTPHRRKPPKGEKYPPTGSRDSDASASYNKPGSIMRWLADSEEPKQVDYVLYIDADMLLRQPMDPVAMGVKPGVVVSEHVGYLDVGIRAGIQREFLDSPEAIEAAGADIDLLGNPKEGKRLSAGGWYHFFYIDDIRKIAPRWFHYCREMRTNPQKYWSTKDKRSGELSIPKDIPTGDAYVAPKQAPWISEMYGYVFAAAEAGVRHILTDGVVVYPDEVGGSRPDESHIIHYGLHCKVHDFSFTKYSFYGFDATGCTGKGFGDPPAPNNIQRLCAETVLTLNDAMCDFYNRPKDKGGCGLVDKVTCPLWEPHDKPNCEDKHSSCGHWAQAGECQKNKGFMTATCPRSCLFCEEAEHTRIPAWDKGLCEAGYQEYCLHVVQEAASTSEDNDEAGHSRGDESRSDGEMAPSNDSLDGADERDRERTESSSTAKREFVPTFEAKKLGTDSFDDEGVLSGKRTLDLKRSDNSNPDDGLNAAGNGGGQDGGKHEELYKGPELNLEEETGRRDGNQGRATRSESTTSRPEEDSQSEQDSKSAALGEGAAEESAHAQLERVKFMFVLLWGAMILLTLFFFSHRFCGRRRVRRGLPINTMKR